MGQRSGYHSGHLHGYSQGDGASFVPDKPVRRRRAGDRARRDRRGQRRQAGRLQLSRRHAVSDGEHHGVPQPTGGARRLSELRHPARRPGPDPGRHRARSRSRGGRHPHDQRSRSRSVRAADLHAAGPARLVRPAAGGRNRGGPERADLRRPARPDVVEGARAVARLRPGRRHRHELPLPDGRQDCRRQRPAGGPARLPDRPERHRLHHGVQPDPLRPLAGERSAATGRSSTRRSRRST